ncbi:MAG: hypothetical protein SF066_15565 [Thermoanaerobaculia bacterium]|nr:hypothetical protein [Thermoanaerobaculia bacterium]
MARRGGPTEEPEFRLYPVDPGKLRQVITVLLGGAGLLIAAASFHRAGAPDSLFFFVVACGVMGFFLVVLGFWVGLSWWPRAAVQTDAEGLWSPVVGRERGLIPWGRITSVVDRPIARRLDLYDGRGRCLLRLSYELENFSGLRNRVLQELECRWPLPPLPVTLSKSVMRQLVGGGLATGSGMLVVFGAESISAAVVFGLLGLAALVWWLRGPEQVVLNQGTLAVQGRLRSFEVPWSQVQGVDLAPGLLDRREVFVELSVRGRLWPVRLDAGYGWPLPRLVSVLGRLATSAFRGAPRDHSARSGSKKGSPPRPRARRTRK